MTSKPIPRERLEFIRKVILSSNDIEQLRTCDGWLKRIIGITIGIPEYNVMKAILFHQMDIYGVSNL